MPMDVLGLEPGWHSHSYSCTYKWSDLFPHPDEMIKEASGQGYKLNLWEHLYVYPKAPFYEELYPYSGDYEVWNGLVPDFAMEEAWKIFEDYHRETFVKRALPVLSWMSAIIRIIILLTGGSQMLRNFRPEWTANKCTLPWAFCIRT